LHDNDENGLVCFCATSSEMSGEMMMAHERIRDSEREMIF